MRSVFIANKGGVKARPILTFFFLYYVACYGFGVISLFAMPSWLRERILSTFQPLVSSLQTHLSSKTFVSTMIFLHASYGILFLFFIWLLFIRRIAVCRHAINRFNRTTLVNSHINNH